MTIPVPVVWPILPFTAWAALACLLASAYSLVNWFLNGRAMRNWWPVAWLLLAVAFAGLTEINGDNLAIAHGEIHLTPLDTILLVLIAWLAVYAMSNTHRAAKAHRVARVVATQLALLAGCVVFGIPFVWLLLTSFKEERDLSSPNGPVWAPQVQETVSSLDTFPPIYETTYRGAEVKGTIMANQPDGQVRLEVVEPTGIQGLLLDRSPSQIRQVPVEAPVVTGLYNGQTVKGLVLREFDDGRQQVRVLAPDSLKGKEFTALAANLAPVRHMGLRLQNYTDALGYLPPEADGGLVFVKNSLIIVIMSVIGTLLSSSMVAYAFSRLKFPGRDVLFGVLLSTMMLPSAVTLLPKFLIFRQLGWIDTLLPLWAPAFFASAFNVFLLRQFFRTIPMELEDAAKLDGCGYLRSYWSVMLPQVKPALAVIAVWTFISAWNDFMGPLIYINSPEKMPVSYAVQIFASDHGTLPGLTMAMATMAVVPVIVLFLFAQRYFMAEGALQLGR